MKAVEKIESLSLLQDLIEYDKDAICIAAVNRYLAIDEQEFVRKNGFLDRIEDQKLQDYITGILKGERKGSRETADSPIPVWERTDELEKKTK